jgi:hypothetical protein
MRKTLIFSGTLLILVLLCLSCHLADFNLNKLAEPNDIKPVVYAPLAYGSYLVGDQYFTILADNDTITDPEIDLDPVIHNKANVTFTSQAIDSLYLMVTFTNGTPMKVQFQFSFIDINSGAVYGKTFDSGIMPAGKTDATGKVIEPVITRVEFPMNFTDMNNASLADGLRYTLKLYQPDTGAVTVKNLKESLYKVQISFRAPVNLSKLD